jgi:ATP-binding cassette subfamily C (CFTR/MRP) protein 1
MIIVWSRVEQQDNLNYGGFGPLLGNSISVGIAGLVLTYTQQITALMNWAIRMACEVENRMTNVERNCEYADLEPEELPEGRGRTRSRSRSRSASNASRRRSFSDLITSTKKVETEIVVRKNWPKNGAIEFKNVNMRYRAGLPLVLKNVNLSIPGGSKVGFCGRSGSGKSSILVALFRMTNVEGIIEVDGVNTSSLRLRELRRAVGIIPQDPVLFVGNLRDNFYFFVFY